MNNMYDVYKLTLRHYVEMPDGKRIEIEEPLQTFFTTISSNETNVASFKNYAINRMFDELRKRAFEEKEE